ncbi:MAG TPA: hypothetical protein VK013_14565 [Myxococcaceae bacterium]|nr:hypothetical protein [Myxococcaceae bacterium]
MSPPVHAAPLFCAPLVTGGACATGEAPLQPDWLPALAQARRLRGRGRAGALRRLHRELRALDADPVLAPVRGAQLLELLRDPGLGTLVGDGGWTARAMVAAALLERGGAAALQLHPDDLQHLREVQARPRRGLRRGARLGLLLLLLAAWAGLALTVGVPPPADAPGPLFNPLQLLALLYGVALPPVLLFEVLWRRISARRQPNVRGVD